METLPDRKGDEGHPPEQRFDIGKHDGPLPKMVRWYSPGQLVRTAIEVLVSMQFGQKADRRLEPWGPTITGDPEDYTVDSKGEPRKELWLDYVADLGDGWNSTYTIAYSLSRKSLEVKGSAMEADNTSYNLPRANILIFGGDQVYPTASRAEYQNRLLRPYEAALRDSAGENPHVYAVPGNHDWYDNLVAFTSIFCTGRWFAGWKTRQKRSYFALKLPYNWWLIGTDVQLSSDIDEPQLQYFKSISAQMKAEDKIILCVAEPHWIYAKASGRQDSDYTESNLAFLERKVFHRKVAVYLAGDLHHYRRHEDESKCQKITSGGGGAFLHPTHGPDVDHLAGGYTLKKSFPEKEESRSICWKNLAFPFLNPSFGVVMGLIYMLIAWGVTVDLSRYGITEFGAAVSTALEGAVRNQMAIFWILLLVGGFILFTETTSRWYRVIGGSLHAITHLAATFLIGWGATYIAVNGLNLEFASTTQLLASGLLLFILSCLIGPLIVGIYFIVSLNGFGRHVGEAFSSLRIEDWKHFLRIKVDDQGITIYPIKFRKVWKAWKVNPGGIEHPELIPDLDAPSHRHGTPPTLIEPPISYVCSRTL